MTRIVILAKAPRAGLAKTRLIPALGGEGAARLAARMLETTVSAAVAANLGPVELRVAPDWLDPAWQGVTIPGGIAIVPQGDGDLGDRLQRAADAALADRGSVLLIGTDCVELSPQLLQEATRALSLHDAVIHPTQDGGYALLGLRRSHDSLFRDMAWSTATVCRDTLQRLETLGWSVARLATLNDIDEPDDLAHLPPHWQEAVHA